MERRPRITNTHPQITPINIPEEIIIEEILPKLPVKSLLRFKCVSKSWRTLISSKRFVETHLENSKKNQSFPHHSIIAVCSRSVGVLNSCPLYPLLTERSTRASPLDYPMADPSKLLIAGCCNGLICVLNGANKFLLWNPATRESKELPDFFTTGVFDPLQYSYGFGFDEISGDYKVFAFTYVGKYIIGKVYSLKANSWRETKVYSDGPPFYREFEEVATFASGKFHWICEYKIKTEMQWEIACFDLKSENFAMVEKPSFNEEDARVYPSLGVVDGCLCLFCKSPIQFDIWIWTKYDGVEKYSWGKFANISYLSDPWTPSSYMTAFLCPFPPSWIPLCVLPNGEVLFTYGSSFVIFDRKDNEYKQRYIDNFEDVDQVEVYVESLVSLVSDDDDGDVEDGQSA